MAGRPKRHLSQAFLLLVGLFLIYNANLRQVSSHDTRASRFVPISILRDGDLRLDEFFRSDLERRKHGEPLPFYLTYSNGHVYDDFPPIGPLLALPVYAVPVWIGIPSNDALLANLISKLAASLMAAASAVMILATTRRLLQRSRPDRPNNSEDNLRTGAAAGPAMTTSMERVALLATLTYALCTPVWSIASQGLWSHAPAVLCLALGLWGLLSGHMILAGLTTGAAAVARPATVPAAALLVLYVAHRAWRNAGDPVTHPPRRKGWRETIWYTLSILAVGTAGEAFNIWQHGSLMGGVPLRNAYWVQTLNASGSFSGSLLGGLAGLTVSPSRGVFVFAPILLIALVGAVSAWKRQLSWPAAGAPGQRSEATLLARYLSLAALAVLLVYAKFIVWWGGNSYGPRYLTDIMPLVALLVAFGLARMTEAPYRLRLGWRRLGDDPRKGAARLSLARTARGALVCLFIYSAFVQAVGATCWPSPWVFNKTPPYYERLWEWRNSQIPACLRAGPRFDPLARRLLGALGLKVPAR
ncbi:MAG: hypothetical protein ACE5HV_09430 [Acidobacteriota bacterium]